LQQYGDCYDQSHAPLILYCSFIWFVPTFFVKFLCVFLLLYFILW
jgi:hypothetical protein